MSKIVYYNLIPDFTKMYTSIYPEMYIRKLHRAIAKFKREHREAPLVPQTILIQGVAKAVL
jgi:hypothetical protein